MTKKIYSFILIFLLPVLFINGTGFSNSYSGSATVEYKNIEGVAPDLLSLDIYYYKNVKTLKPVVIYIHGGGWFEGDKKNKLYNKKSFFSSLGYIFVSVNYRLSPSTFDLAPGRIMYPVHNNDVADAARWIYDNIGNYGGDREKIVLIGHSAGAHLVSLTGTHEGFLPERGIPLNAIKGVASIDTEGYDVGANAGSGSKIYINAFGTDPVVWKDASPIYNIYPGKDYPAFFIAKRGTAKRMGLADRFISILKENGVVVFEINGSIYDHAGINEAIGAPGETLISGALKDFLEYCFK